MNNFGFESFLFSVIVVTAGLLFVNRLVAELAPRTRRRWLLGLAIGSGVIVFTLKVAFAVIFSFYAEDILALLPDKASPGRPSSAGELPAFIEVGTGDAAYQWQALPETAPFPPDNPPSPEKVRLGRALFLDKRLSLDGSVACAGCHEISNDKGGADGDATSTGVGGRSGQRNAPTVLNAAFFTALFWDGRAGSLEEQVRGPLLNEVEMAMPSLDAVVDRVRAIPSYPPMFAAAFGEGAAIDIDAIAKAIAAFERTLVTPNAAYDRFVRGDATALSDRQLRGMALFESTGCVACHRGPAFSAAAEAGRGDAYRMFPAVPGTEYAKRYRLDEDTGLADADKNAGRGVWRVPSLRNVARTAPYFHNGSVDSLAEAVRIMSRVQLNKRLSNDRNDDRSIRWHQDTRRLHVHDGEALSDDEVDDIVAFLEALNGELPVF
ncbi:cytochrome-c peroxidase [Thiosocius teredinicola]|uniref:cytochrome-c peroxidase n=1 Tax=Thiosocius teredinicola TaxID=1973002 RepID=UPI000990F5CD